MLATIDPLLAHTHTCYFNVENCLIIYWWLPATQQVSNNNNTIIIKNKRKISIFLWNCFWVFWMVRIIFRSHTHAQFFFWSAVRLCCQFFFLENRKNSVATKPCVCVVVPLYCRFGFNFKRGCFEKNSCKIFVFGCSFPHWMPQKCFRTNLILTFINFAMFWMKIKAKISKLISHSDVEFQTKSLK